MRRGRRVASWVVGAAMVAAGVVGAIGIVSVVRGDRADEASSTHEDDGRAGVDRAEPVDTSDILVRIGPITAFLYGPDPIDVELGLRTRQVAVTADCMRERGWTFEYVPPTAERVRIDLMSGRLASPIGDDAFRERWGYGVTRGLLDPDADAELSPNAALAPALDDQERPRYDADDGECTEAGREATGVVSDEWVELQRLESEELAGPSAALGEDNSAAGDGWRSCMLDAGYDVQAPQDAFATLDERAAPLFQTMDATGELTAAQRAQAQALLADEVAQAATDWACQEATTLPVQLRQANQIEGVFVEEHSDLLTAARGQLNPG